MAIRRLSKLGFAPIQLINHNVNGYYFVFGWDCGERYQAAAVDVIFEHRRGGLIADNGAKITATRERFGEFWIAAPPMEFSYLLLKKVVKGKIKSEQANRLKELVKLLGSRRAEEIAREIFPDKWSKAVVAACLDGTLPELLPRLKKLTWVTSLTRHPVRLLQYVTGDLTRWVRRWIKPNGLLVTVLGPDGVGKSSAIDSLHDQIGPAFWGERYFHWRPQLIARKRAAAPVADPHAKPPRGPILSSLYLTAFLADHCLGYLLVLRQLKPRSFFLLFDRYFYDVLVDRKRVRFGGPMGLARFYSKIVASPDLVLVLEADTDTIVARKSELPPEEVDRQREAYRKLPVDPARMRFINTNGTREEVAHQAAKAIAVYMSRRFTAMYPEWYGGEA